MRVGERVFVAGTAPQFDDGTCPTDPALQARRCFEIIGEALSAAGSSFADVVRTRIYLVSTGDFAPISAVHGEYFHDIRPANTTIVVKELLDTRWKVEIEAEAVISPERSPVL